MKAHRPADRISVESYTATMYRDDLEVVVDDLKENLKLQISIEDEHASFNDFDDVLRVRGSRPRTLRILGRLKVDSPVPVVSFEYRSAHWHLGAPASEAVARRIEDLMKARQSWLEPRAWGSAAFVVALLLLASGQLLLAAGEQRVGVALAVVGMVVAAFGLWIFLGNPGLGGVNLRYRHESGYWARNRESVLNRLIGALARVLGTLLSQWIIGTLRK